MAWLQRLGRNGVRPRPPHGVRPPPGADARTHTPIDGYGIIGDCRTAALVATDGGIDWLCVPRFDSPSVFAALLDARKGGTFRIAPVEAGARITRRYVGASNVLETTFVTSGGTLRLTDAMSVADEAEKTRTLWPDHEILRLVECVEGAVDVRVEFSPRPDYARVTPVLRRGRHETILCEAGSGILTLRSGVPLTISSDAADASGAAHLTAGERVAVGLSYGDALPAVLPPCGDAAWAVVDMTVRWWEEWGRQLTFDWRYRDAVLRSALVLKLLTYAPSGAMVAAPTTSLPEHIGGIRNWDYRFCWLRDASLTLRALVDAGFGDEAEAFLSWVLHATALTQPRLQIMYDVYGETELHEQTLDHLDGYLGSRPVRIGNDAAGQLQLDVYGEVVDAVHFYIERGGRIDRYTERLLLGLGRTVVALWGEADEGIWEPRGGRRQNTHSKVMCWVALDRLIKLHASGRLRGSIDGFDAARHALRDEIERRAWSPRLRSYSAVFDEDVMDATLLRMSIYGYADPRSERMSMTVERVREELGSHGFLYRYHAPDGLPSGEGAFVICGFWLVEALALEGRLDEAAAEFERLTATGSDLGLFSEEIDPSTRALLGNFPQAFSHIGLINAAETLAACAGAPQAQPAVRRGRPL